MEVQNRLQSQLPWMASFLVGCASLFWFYLDIKKDEQSQSSGELFGEVEISSASQEDISRLPQNRWVWIPAKHKSQVYFRDSIKTGLGTEASLTSNDLKSKILLRENSLITLEKAKEGLSIKVANGQLQLKGKFIAKLSDNQILKSDDATSVVALNKENQKTEIQTIKGKASLDAKEGTQTLNEGTQASLQTNQDVKIRTLEVQIDSPRAGETYQLKQSQERIPFKYTIKSKQVSLKKLRLKMSTPKESQWLALQKIPKSGLQLSEGTWTLSVWDDQQNNMSGDFTFEIKEPRFLRWAQSENTLPRQAIQSKDGIHLKPAIHFEASRQFVNFDVSVFLNNQKVKEWTQAAHLPIESLPVLSHEMGLIAPMKIVVKSKEDPTRTIEHNLDFANLTPPNAPKVVSLDVDPKDFNFAWLKLELDAGSANKGSIVIQLGRNFESRLISDAIENGTKFKISTKTLFQALKADPTLKLEVWHKLNDQMQSEKTSYTIQNSGRFALATLLENKPLTFYPADGTRILLAPGGQSAKVKLQFELPLEVTQYPVQAYLVRGKGIREQRLNIKDPSIEVTRPGKFSWQLQAIYEGEHKTTWSEEVEFEVAPEPLQNFTPTLRAPASKNQSKGRNP